MLRGGDRYQFQARSMAVLRLEGAQAEEAADREAGDPWACIDGAAGYQLPAHSRERHDASAVTGSRQTDAEIMPDPLWYKDAIIYQAHVRAFLDTNRTASAIFAGSPRSSTTSRSSASTRAVAAALLPVAAPRRRLRHRRLQNIHPAYGTLEDFDRFIAEAHAATSASSPSWSSTTRPISTRGSRRRGARRPDRASATSTSGATRTEVPRRPDHLLRHREVELDVGRRSPARTTGTASSTISRI